MLNMYTRDRTALAEMIVFEEVISAGFWPTRLLHILKVRSHEDHNDGGSHEIYPRCTPAIHCLYAR